MDFILQYTLDVPRFIERIPAAFYTTVTATQLKSLLMPSDL